MIWLFKTPNKFISVIVITVSALIIILCSIIGNKNLNTRIFYNANDSKKNNFIKFLYHVLQNKRAMLKGIDLYLKYF